MRSLNTNVVGESAADEMKATQVVCVQNNEHGKDRHGMSLARREVNSTAPPSEDINILLYA